jgi:hypothetical protein
LKNQIANPVIANAIRISAICAVSGGAIANKTLPEIKTNSNEIVTDFCFIVMFINTNPISNRKKNDPQTNVYTSQMCPATHPISPPFAINASPVSEKFVVVCGTITYIVNNCVDPHPLVFPHARYLYVSPGKNVGSSHRFTVNVPLADTFFVDDEKLGFVSCP